jgi:hypothetical protein
MFYFTYTKTTLSDGSQWGPEGHMVHGDIANVEYSGSLYGKTSRQDLDYLLPYSPVEVTEYDFMVASTKQEGAEWAKFYFFHLLAAGYDTGFGYSLALGEADRNAFTQLLVLLREAGAPDDMQVSIADTNGHLHSVSVAQLRPMLVGYGLYYNQLWANYKASVI